MLIRNLLLKSVPYRHQPIAAEIVRWALIIYSLPLALIGIIIGTGLFQSDTVPCYGQVETTRANPIAGAIVLGAVALATCLSIKQFGSRHRLFRFLAFLTCITTTVIILVAYVVIALPSAWCSYIF